MIAPFAIITVAALLATRERGCINFVGQFRPPGHLIGRAEVQGEAVGGVNLPAAASI